MKSTRGEFLSASIALAALPQAAAAASPSPAPAPTVGPLQFDVAAFDTTLNVPALHKHMFAAAKLNGGLILGQTRSVLEAYRDIGVALKEVQPALVFYHFSTCLGFDDVAWNEYFLPMQAKTGKNMVEFATDFKSIYDGKSRGNPCLHKTGKDDDSSIESLVADANARFFVCNNATRFIAGSLAKQLKLAPKDVYANMAAHLVPNAVLVPAGVWAIQAIQERRYTYLQATL